MRHLTTIIVHCSDTEQGTVESIRQYHKAVRGWQDIGYHYVIERTGRLNEGRPLEQAGAHCEGNNQDSIGVCLIGKQAFEPTQFQTLKSLINGLRIKYPTITQVRGHREFASALRQGKTCPSDAVMQYLIVNHLHI